MENDNSIQQFSAYRSARVWGYRCCRHLALGHWQAAYQCAIFAGTAGRLALAGRQS